MTITGNWLSEQSKHERGNGIANEKRTSAPFSSHRVTAWLHCRHAGRKYWSLERKRQRKEIMKERRGQKRSGKGREREPPQAFCLPFRALHKQLKQSRAPYSFICFSPLSLGSCPTNYPTKANIRDSRFSAVKPTSSLRSNPYRKMNLFMHNHKIEGMNLRCWITTEINHH